jgi:lysophospholipase L1-like esterase
MVRTFAAAVLAAGLVGGGWAASGAAVSSPPIRVVALGDSDAHGEGDPTRRGWVGRYARLLRQRRGLNVQLTNLAANGQSSSELVAALRLDGFTRTTVRKADIVLFGTGGADLNAGDDWAAAGTCKGNACWATCMRSDATSMRRWASCSDPVARSRRWFARSRSRTSSREPRRSCRRSSRGASARFTRRPSAG